MPPLSTSKWDELTRHTIFYNDPLSRSRHHPRLPAAHRLEARREQRNIAERDQYKTRFADVQLPLAAFHFDQHGYGNGTCTDTLHNWACSSWLVKRPRLRRTIYGFLLMFIFFILVALNWAGWQKSNWTNRAPLLTFDFTQFSATDQQQAAHASISLFDTGATDISQQYHIYFTHWCATSNNVTRVSSDGSQPPDWPAKNAVICGERHLGVPDLLKEWHLETDVTELQSTDATSASFFEAFGQWMGVVSRLVALALVCISVVVLAEIVRVVIQFWRSWVKRCFCCLEIDREPSDGRDVGPTEAAWALKCKPAGCGRRARRMCCSLDILCCYDPLSVQYRAYLAGHGKYDHYADAEERYNNVRRLYLGYLRKSMFLHVMQCLLVLVSRDWEAVVSHFANHVRFRRFVCSQSCSQSHSPRLS